MTSEGSGPCADQPQGAAASLVIRHSWLLYTLLTMLLWGGWGLVSKPGVGPIVPLAGETIRVASCRS